MTEYSTVVGSGAIALLLDRSDADAGASAAVELLAGETPGAKNVLAVLCDRSSAGFLSDWRRRVDGVPNDVRILDVGQLMRSAASQRASAGADHALVRSVERPVDLPALERTLREYLAEWDDSGVRTVVYLDSLSTLLQDAPLSTVVQFLDGTKEAIADHATAGYVRLSTTDPSDRSVRVLGPLFDAVLELDAAGDGWEPREPARRPVAPSGDRHRVPDVSLDEVFDVLSSRRRRQALYCLQRNDGPMATRELAEQIAAGGHEAVDGAASDLLKRVYTGLRHAHLPKLASLGIVSVDDDWHTVDLGDGIVAVEPYLILAAAHDPERDIP